MRERGREGEGGRGGERGRGIGEERRRDRGGDRGKVTEKKFMHYRYCPRKPVTFTSSCLNSLINLNDYMLVVSIVKFRVEVVQPL